MVWSSDYTTTITVEIILTNSAENIHIMSDILSKNLMGWHLLENIAPFETLTDLAPSSYLHHFRQHLLQEHILLLARYIFFHEYTLLVIYKSIYIFHIRRRTHLLLRKYISILSYTFTDKHDFRYIRWWTTSRLYVTWPRVTGTYWECTYKITMPPINPLFFVFTHHNLCST